MELTFQSSPVKAYLEENRHARQHVPTSAELQSIACEATGLDDFGDTAFLGALEVLLESVTQEGMPNRFGWHVLSSHALRVLKNRLLMQAWLKQFPQTLNRRITSPVIIVGPHRSGTTRLHRLLAMDGRFQYLRAWEGLNPAPYPALSDFGAARRRQEIDAMLTARRLVYPGASLAHAMHADYPEEETLLLHQSFQSFLLFGFYMAPGFYRWFLGSDKSDAYRTMATALRALSLSRGTPENVPWILKCPQHMLNLDVLISTFPDAKLIFTHRDPAKTVGSVLSLMWHYAVQHTDASARPYIRDVWWDFCQRSAYRCREERKKIPTDRQLDVQYGDMDRDWRSCMARIYEFIGMDLSSDVVKAMQSWLEACDREQAHGQHRYSLEDFELSALEVRRKMMEIQ